jgi:hypothetical protein
MFKIVFITLVLFGLMACNRTDTIATPNQTIITSDSSQFTGRLKVIVLDGTNSNSVINGAQVFLYPTYDDMKRNYYINTVSSISGSADFGFILQGNYYLRAESGLKGDTNVVQVMGQKTITRTMIVK